MPFSSTVVIPAGWSAHHRPVSTGGQTATCSIRQLGGTGKSFNSTTGTTTSTPNTPYVTSVPCRVNEASPAATAALFGEQYVSSVTAIVTLDWTVAGDVDVQVDDILTVTAADDNASTQLVDRVFRVVAVQVGSLEWERVVGCTTSEG